MKGFTHIYCGEGKGKTTAATGLAIRAAGNDMKILFVRFLKNEDSSELKVLDTIPQIHVMHLEKSYGFYNTLHDSEKREMEDTYHKLWDDMKCEVASGRYQVLIIDELMAACQYKIIEVAEVLRFLEQKPEELEVVMTGRYPDEKLIAIADYVSEVKKVKHPYDYHIGARKGIEY